MHTITWVGELVLYLHHPNSPIKICGAIWTVNLLSFLDENLQYYMALDMVTQFVMIIVLLWPYFTCRYVCKLYLPFHHAAF